MNPFVCFETQHLLGLSLTAFDLTRTSGSAVGKHDFG
jgi:hypothetical protein